MQKGFSNLIIIGLIVLVGVAGAVGWFLNEKNNVVGIPEIEEGNVLLQENETADWKTYRNEEYGFEVKYPSDTFKVVDIEDSVVLQSSYFITDNPSGIPGKDRNHTFSIGFDVQYSNILDTIKQRSPYAFSQIFPTGTLEDFKVIDNFSKYFNVADRHGFSFSSGNSGIYIDYAFLPKNSSETLVILFNNFNNRDFGSFPESANISLEKQNEIFNSVIATLQFIN